MRVISCLCTARSGTLDEDGLSSEILARLDGDLDELKDFVVMILNEVRRVEARPIPEGGVSFLIMVGSEAEKSANKIVPQSHTLLYRIRCLDYTYSSRVAE